MIDKPIDTALTYDFNFEKSAEDLYLAGRPISTRRPTKVKNASIEKIFIPHDSSPNKTPRRRF